MAELNMALLLKESLNNMRGELGKDCTYLAFEKEGDLLFLCAKLKNELGGTDKVKQKINTLKIEVINNKDNLTLEDLFS